MSDNVDRPTTVRQDALTPLRLYSLGLITGAIRSTLTLERVIEREARALVACELLGITTTSRIEILEVARSDARIELGPDADCFDVRLFAAELVIGWLRILSRRPSRAVGK